MRDLVKLAQSIRSDVNRRNFWLGVANGVLYAGAEALTDPSVVLTYFTSLLTTSKLPVGLVAPMRIGGWFLPQLFVSGIIQRQERKLPIYTQLGVVRALAWGLMVLALWFITDQAVLLGFLFLFLIAYSLAEGLAGLSFMDVVGKVVPPDRRGAFFGARRLGGGGLALASSAVVAWALSERSGLKFPHVLPLFFFPLKYMGKEGHERRRLPFVFSVPCLWCKGGLDRHFCYAYLDCQLRISSYRRWRRPGVSEDRRVPGRDGPQCPGYHLAPYSTLHPDGQH